ncbi:hypothetical protein [Neolewinella agarilytica]|uniref:Outer membrane protein beta-barrel domain-containing protein n=1 Tax=Neolewinella agarilytica TaxID=478744 RepID=A0A1H9GDC1_9BACT|nr:hypothetical protein [Neolewinella agarilytica]SEQ48077.1 hypothetical protein SAMN05444359_110135 [Neolewinella agarilytica]
MKLLILSLLLSLSFTGGAQFSVKSIDVQSGATLMDWDGFIRGSIVYSKRWGYFLGSSLKVRNSPSSKGYILASINYRKTHTDRTTNFERIKLDEFALTLGLGQDWKKMRFSFNSSFIFVSGKEKIDNTPMNGIDLANVENFYLTLSGKLAFSITNKLALFVEQAFFETKVYHTYTMRRGERFEVPDYPSWTLLGLSYAISKRD